MIKIDKNIYDGIKDYYVNSIIDCIKKRYEKNAEKISSKKYFNYITVKSFFETKGILDCEKIKKLLLLDFTEITDTNINNYIKTANLCYGDFKENNYQKMFVPNDNNMWLNYFFEKNTCHYKSEKNYRFFIDEVKKEFDDFNKEIKLIIDYDLISSSLRHKIIVSSNISVCPYCNRQYISYFFDEGDKKKTTADLDHFYPKSIFKLFSLSLYNFIPSCQICNQRFKRTTIKKIVYPFKYGFDDRAKFVIDAKDGDAFFGLNDNFDIDINIDDQSKYRQEIDNSIKLFNLKSLYQHHKPYVKEILMKKNLVYTESYLEMMNNTFTKLNFSNEQINAFLYGFDLSAEIYKDTKPLGKLTRDLFDKQK